MYLLSSASRWFMFVDPSTVSCPDFFYLLLLLLIFLFFLVPHRPSLSVVSASQSSPPLHSIFCSITILIIITTTTAINHYWNKRNYNNVTDLNSYNEWFYSPFTIIPGSVVAALTVITNIPSLRLAPMRRPFLPFYQTPSWKLKTTTVVNQWSTNGFHFSLYCWSF